MAIENKHPAVKYTVGAQYICFNKMSDENEWTEEFEETVYKLPTVVDIDVSDNDDSYDLYASGDIYDSDTTTTSKEISETNVAFPTELLAKMKGDDVDSGVILEGGPTVRPFFAYGVPIMAKDGTYDMRWYPKCKLTENSDAAQTSTDSHSDQNDTITIKAYGFNDDKQIAVRAETANETLASLTEDSFFAAPLLTRDAVLALVSSSKSSSTASTTSSKSKTATE